MANLPGCSQHWHRRSLSFFDLRRRRNSLSTVDFSILPIFHELVRVFYCVIIRIQTKLKPCFFYHSYYSILCKCIICCSCRKYKLFSCWCYSYFIKGASASITLGDNFLNRFRSLAYFIFFTNVGCLKIIFTICKLVYFTL